LLTLPILDRHIAIALWSDPPALIIDLTCVDFLSCAGMQLLLDTHDLILAGNRLAVITTPYQLRIFRIVGVAEAITTYYSLDDALTARGPTGTQQPPSGR
jgi:anti-anti-sigma regulatory factor